MPLTVEERKARRLAGMKRAEKQMTDVQRIQRALINGRPPVGEMKTPTAAIAAARTLYKELQVRMVASGLKPKPGDWAVSVGYVSPDLSVFGFSPLYAPDEEAALERTLAGQLPVGLVFGMRDKDAVSDEGEIVMGARPFFVLRPQTDDWLAQLIPGVRLEIEDP